MNRRSAMLAMGAFGLGPALRVEAAAFPDKPLKIIVPYAAGGGVDNITRIISTPLSNRLKQPVIVDNRPGANANLGSDMVAKAPPDGYTVLMGSTYLCFNRATMKSVPYDAGTDLLPVARTGEAPYVMAIPATAAAKTVAEMVADIKANPGKSSYGAVGAGSPNTLIFKQNTGVDSVLVLYKGGSAAMPDLISGRLTYMIQTASEILPHVASGKLRALAVTGRQRFKALPDVPTFTEAGVSGLEDNGWWGVFAPAHTPAPIVKRLSDEIQVVMKQADVIESLDKIGVESSPLPAAKFQTYYNAQLQSFANVAKQFNLSVD